MNLNQLFCEMIQYYRNDPKRIQHFTKVHSYATVSYTHLDGVNLFIAEHRKLPYNK